MLKQVSEHSILKVLYNNQGRLLDSSEVADYFNTCTKVYDDEAAGVMKRLEELGLIYKEMRKPVIGYEISRIGIKYLLCS